ncbi:FeoB-associated Cys-rich membrane protein [Ancylomarina sp. 16SWW S1-10-2]|uniref:FeoB-associated Cys-rich membrane protein n=1 Tax=Ancylomarina sp. 16SWW S1-10-2 TaxID=2499681 RepID=UPI0012AE752A|nr:FeoB-associated Cys-rich membrane protein [Ancylomarina sp. 16SWW S1-10-2]MRT94830.1 FeoB-associated Cys-rich membrane protein [Ancylomarina sp. 16SWW S1-10-2]
MDFQLIITYLIILAAVSYAGFHLYRVIKPPKNRSICGGCSSCQFKKDLMKNKIRMDELKMADNTKK